MKQSSYIILPSIWVLSAMKKNVFYQSKNYKYWLISLFMSFFSFALNGQQNPADKAILFLKEQIDRCHIASFVYLNGNDACNIFIPHIEGDIRNFPKATEQYNESPGSWRSNGFLVYKPLENNKGYTSWVYTYGRNNFGQLPGINMKGADSLIFYLKGKGTIEVTVGGANRAPFYDRQFLYQDGVDIRSTGFITLKDTGWTKYVLYLADNRFWVYKGPKAGATNMFPVWAYYKDNYDCSEYLHVSLDSVDETGNDCIAITWMRPDSIINSPTKYSCYGGIGFLSPNIDVRDWKLDSSQGYDLKGLSSICFYAKLSKKGWIEVNFNSSSNPGGKQKAYFSLDTVWRKCCWSMPNQTHFSRTNLGFGVAFIPIDRGPITPDSVTLFLDSIYYVGTTLKSNFDSLIIGTKITVPKVLNRDSAIIFFDSIHFNRSRLDEFRVPQSFVIPNNDTLFLSQQMTGHIYDASLVAIALLAKYYKTGNKAYLNDAIRIGDAFVYAQKNDRYFSDGRLRNVYAAGLFIDADKKAKLPGYWNEQLGEWIEDEYDVSTSTGNIAWAALALISLYEATDESKYLDAAKTLAKWCIQHTWDDKGFTGGYLGWDTKQVKLKYIANEHCIDLFAVFTRLFKITNDSIYYRAATHADIFVKSMWDNENGKFFTGTLADGTGIINKSVIPTDLQPWYLFAYNDRSSDFKRGYYWAKDSTYIKDHTHPGDTHVYKGFDFSKCIAENLDGVGYEFTGQMTACACWLGDTSFYNEMLTELEYIQVNGLGNNGKGFRAACHDRLSTCFDWQYHRILHTGGATCWYLFAKERINPYYNPNIQFGCGTTVSTKSISENTIPITVAPNPSNGMAAISFSLSTSQNLFIKVLDMDGKLIKILSYNHFFQTGTHQVNFDTQGLSSGLYICQVLSNNNLIGTGKIVIID